MKSTVQPPKKVSAKTKSAAKRSIKKEVRSEASTEVLALPKGLYLFSVRKSPKLPESGTPELSLPYIEIGPGPGVATDQFEILFSPNMTETRLITQGDVIVGKVSREGVAVLITSIRPPEFEPLEIQIQRLDTHTIDRNPVPAPKAIVKTSITGSSQNSKLEKPAADQTTRLAAVGDIPLQIVAHVQNRGDVPFIDTLWAGFLGSNLAIEALSVAPTVEFDGGQIEYKTLDAGGGETPWATDGALCGSRGKALPLTGFCVRVKTQAKGPMYDCEYSGAFTSGKVVGPIKNGAPCRSTMPGDFLEAVQVKIFKRPPANT